MSNAPKAIIHEAVSIELLPYLMNRLTSRINQLWLRELRPHGLTIPRWQVLSVLVAFNGCRIGELAEMTATEQAVVSRVVDQMQRDGLVERKPGREDFRRVEVWITRQGRALHRKLLPAAELHIKELVKTLPAERSRLMAGELMMMLEGLGG